MSIYSGFSKPIEPVSFMEMVDFIYESTSEIDRMFDRYIYIESLKEEGILTEETLAIAGPTSKAKFDFKEFAKKIGDKIKELWEKFEGFVKDLIEKISKSIHEMYMNTNVMDKLISKNKEIVTYENLTKAKDAGWAGLPTSLPMVTKLVNIRDSGMYNVKDSDSFLQCRPEDVEKIMDAKDDEEAQAFYDEFKKKYKEFKDHEWQDSKFGLDMAENMRSLSANTVKLSQQISGRDYTEEDLNIINDDLFKRHYDLPANHKDGKYFPPKEAFNISKDLAENGQRKVKELNQSNKQVVANIKSQKISNLRDYKTFKENNVKQATLYYKAKYEYSAAVVERFTVLVKSVLSMARDQYRVCLQQYMLELDAIKRLKIA